MEKEHINDDDYILEILEKEEDIVLEDLCKKIPNEIKYEFSKLLAIINTIEKIYKEKSNNKLNNNII